MDKHTLFKTVTKSGEQKRVERDQHQVRCAAARYKALRKMIPKRLREREIERARATKEFVHEFSAREDVTESTDCTHEQAPGGAEIIKEQGMLANAAVAAAGAASCALIQTVRGLVSNTNKVVEKSETLVEKVHSALENFAKSVKDLVGGFWVVPVAIVAHYLLTKLIDIPLLPFLSGLFLARLFGVQVWEQLKGHFGAAEQSGDSVCSFGALLCAAVAAVCVPPKSASFVTGELIKRMGSYPRAKEGFEVFFKDAMKFAENLINKVLGLFSEKEVKWVGESERMVSQFVSKVDSFESLVRCQADKVSLEDVLAAVDMQLVAIGLKTTVRDPQGLIRIERALSRLSVLLVPYQGAITAARNFRPEPTFVCFYGKSAVGKTTLVTKLAITILVKSGLCRPDDALRNLWQKGNTEYWNGYVNQKCLIMDDCFQVKPVKGETDNEYMNVIRMIGNWAYALNFADLESKGKFYFDTPLVIGTTNCADVYHIADAIINDPGAVVRRIKHAYQVVVSPDYLTSENKLDYRRVASEFAENIRLFEERHGGQPADMADVMDMYPWEAWTLIAHDFSTGLRAGGERPVRGLIDEIVDGIKLARDSHNQEIANQEKFLRHLAAAKPVSTEDVVLQSGLGGQSSVEDSFSTPEIGDARESLPYLPFSSKPPEGFDLLELNERDRKGYKQARYLNRCNEKAEHWRVGNYSKLGDHIRHFWACANSGLARFVFGVDDSPTYKLLTGGAIWLATFALTIGVVKAVTHMVSSLLRKVRGTPRGEPQSNIKSSENAPKKVYFKPKITKQNGGMTGSLETNHDIVYKNSYKMIVRGVKETYVVGQVLFVEGRVALMPFHFLRQLWEKHESGDVIDGSIVELIHAGSNHRINLTALALLDATHVKGDGMDACFVEFPKGSIQARRTITQHFLTAEQYNSAIKAKPGVRLDVLDESPIKGEEGVFIRRTFDSNSFEFMPKLMSGGYENEQVLKYSMPTKEGYCGAPLMISNNKHYGSACCLGMHVAGSSGFYTRYGYANVITREIVKAALEAIADYKDEFFEDCEARGHPVQAESGFIPSFIKGSFCYLGKVDKPVSLNPKTKLKLSPVGEIQAFGVQDGAPARLRPFFVDGELVSPMDCGLEGYSSEHTYKQLPDMDAIVSLATKPFREASISDYRGILTKEEAVVGIEGMKLKPIARSKSAGYPYNVRVKGGKKEFFGDGDEFTFDSEMCRELFERVDYVVSKAGDGVRVSHIFTDFLKDEIRPMRKVETGATRIISGCPLDLVVAVRMYFGAFMASMFKHHTRSGMCPGINPYNEWFELGSRLSSKGDKVFDGDFKGFDKGEQPWVHHAILDFIQQWYGGSEVEARIRSILWLELIHSRHLGGDGTCQQHVYQWNKCMPSGHPLTTPVNSLYSLITLTACYVRATRDYTGMWSHVYIGTFGDDNITNVSDSVAEVFNQVTVASMMQELFGLEYTSGNKTGQLVPYTTLDQCTFLKRRFVRDKEGTGGWIAPLELGSVLYRTYYFKNARDPWSDILHNMEEMLGELCLHDEATWEKYFPVAVGIMEEVQAAPMFLTRAGYRTMMADRIDAWF